MKKTVTCPMCGKEVKRQTALVQNHYLLEHDEKISEGDAVKFITRSNTSNKYPARIRKSYREVSGGHYGLGRSRKH